jgi:hypothetical protein
VKLLADTTITYRPQGQIVTRRARLFEGKGGTRLCVVTESADSEGMSVTNAIELVLDAVRDDPVLGARKTAVIEHYDQSNPGGETFDLVSRTVTGDRPEWERLTRTTIDRDWPGLTDQL